MIAIALRPDQIIKTIIGYHHLRGYQRFAIETNQFQEFLADELERQSARQRLVPVSRINHTSDKLGRIQRMQPLITSGMVRFSRRHVTLLEQMRQFPHAAHDDGPDALEMAIEGSRHIDIPRGRYLESAAGLLRPRWLQAQNLDSIREMPQPPGRPYRDDNRGPPRRNLPGNEWLPTYLI